MTGWAEYWQTLPEGRLLFEPESVHAASRIIDEFQPGPATRILDFGCGYGAVALQLARTGASVHVWDVAASMREAAARHPQLHAWQPGQLGEFDLILLLSVVQYLSPTELAQRLSEFRELLPTGGRVVLADLSPPGHSTLADMQSLFWFSLKKGYLLRALRNTLRERGRYNATASQAPLWHPTAEEITAAAVGFEVADLDKNLTHFRTRRTAVLTKR
jgi:cyclopropane fatty-acyl-phospholipid synthase-like methyltransferase